MQSTNDFEILYRGTLDAITNWNSAIVIREKEAWPNAKGGWNRTYGFADGHSEIHQADDGDFAALHQVFSRGPRLEGEISVERVELEIVAVRFAGWRTGTAVAGLAEIIDSLLGENLLNSNPAAPDLSSSPSSEDQN